jgi:hypothetical protein
MNSVENSGLMQDEPERGYGVSQEMSLKGVRIGMLGTTRRECWDISLFWTRQDLESKLRDFQDYYYRYRMYPPTQGSGSPGRPIGSSGFGR